MIYPDDDDELPPYSPDDENQPSFEYVSNYEQTMQSIRLLEATHCFPCPIMVKVIGRVENDFIYRIVEALRMSQRLNDDPPYRLRHTPNGRHVALTYEPFVESAEEVLVIYEHIRAVDGVVMVM